MARLTTPINPIGLAAWKAVWRPRATLPTTPEASPLKGPKVTSPTSERTSERTQNKLKGKNWFAFLKYVEANFTASQMVDAEFAVKAQADLGFPITKNNVQGAREALEIPSYTASRSTEQAGSLAARLSTLERKVEDLHDLLRSIRGEVAK